MGLLIAESSGSGFLTDTMTNALTTAFSAVGSDVQSIINVALPVALGIMGVMLALRLGIGFFKSVSR